MVKYTINILRHSVNLIITKLVFGKYSKEYYSKYKKTYHFPPYINPLKESFIPDNIELCGLINDDLDYKTDVNIDFHDVPFLSSFKSVLKYYGQPDEYVIDSIKGFEIVAASYKNMLQNTNNKILFYFFEDKLIEVEYLFCNVLKDKCRDICLNFIHKKFISQYKTPDSDTVFIGDTNNNIIFAKWNGFDYSIKFLSSDGEAFRQTLIEYDKSKFSILSNKMLGVEDKLLRDLQDAFFAFK